MATDLAEFLGGAIGLSLLFGMPLLAGMLVTGVIVYGLLMFEPMMPTESSNAWASGSSGSTKWTAAERQSTGAMNISMR
jgi:hypothetical protein